jgi:hypothetical protein
LTATDPETAKRTWQTPMDEMTKTKTGSTRIRHERAMKDAAFDLIRDLPIVETQSGHFLKVLETGMRGPPMRPAVLLDEDPRSRPQIRRRAMHR